MEPLHRVLLLLRHLDAHPGILQALPESVPLRHHLDALRVGFFQALPELYGLLLQTIPLILEILQALRLHQAKTGGRGVAMLDSVGLAKGVPGATLPELCLECLDFGAKVHHLR